MDLLSKIKSIFNKTMDDEGWVRGGRFAPLVNIADKTKNLKSFSQTLNPTYNKGDNFWSSKTGQSLANFQRQTQDLVKPTLNRLKQGKSLLNLYEYSSPAVALRHKVDNTQSQLPTNYKPWQDIKHSLSAGMTAYGLAKPNIALTSALGGGVFNTALNMGSNVINKKPLTQNNATAFKQGFGQGLANAGTTRVTNSLVEHLANYIPALKPLTNKALNQPFQSDTLKQAIKKWADVAGKKLFKSAVIETMVETPVWATLNSSDKEKWTDAMKKEFVENLVTNIGFAGVDSIGDVAKMSPVIKKTIGDVVQKYKNLPVQQKMGGYINPKAKIGKQDPLEALKNEAKKYKSAEELKKAIGTDYTINYPNHNKFLEQIDETARKIASSDKKFKKLYGDFRKTIRSGIIGDGDEKMFAKATNQWQEVYDQTIADIYNQAHKPTIKIKQEPTSLAKIKYPKLSDQVSQKTLQPEIDKIGNKVSSDNIISQAKKEIGSPSENKQTFRQKLDKFYTNYVNPWYPVEKLTSNLEKKTKTKILPKYSPEYTITQLKGAGGTAELRHKKVLQPILDRLDKIGIGFDDMDVFLKAKRDLGFNQVGREIIGSDPKLAQQRINALGSKYDIKQLDEIAGQLYKYQDDNLRKLVEIGFLSPDSYEKIKSQNVNYVPFQRVRDEIDNYLGLPTRSAQPGQPIKKIKGSKRKILSPLESIIADTYKIESAVAKNRVAKSIVDLRKISPEYEKMFPVAKKVGNDTISVWENGKKVNYKVGKEIADVVKGLNEENAGTLFKMLSVPARLLRQGATGRNIDFMIPNVVKDQFDAAINSKYGYVPFYDYFRGLRHLINYNRTGSDDLMESWMKHGGQIFFENMSGRKGIKEQIMDATKKKGFLKKLSDWAVGGIETIGEYSEVPTRLGLFKRAIEKTGNPLISAKESREGTLDFARIGSKMKTANSVIPFLNVGVQGFDKLIRTVKGNPKKTALLLSAYAGLPALVTSAYNNLFHSTELQEIPTWVKDTNFVIITGRDENGKVNYIKIPKGNVVPLVANPTEELVTWMAGNSPRDFKELALSLLSETAPVIGGGSNFKEIGVRTIGKITPQAFKPTLENLLNKSTFKTTPEGSPKDIVPYYLEKKPPSEQHQRWTPNVYKALGKILNVSPLKAQNFLEGTFAGGIKTPVMVTETLDKLSRGEKPDVNQIPILRRFFGQTYGDNKTIKIKSKKSRFAVNAQELPKETEDLKTLYKDALSDVNNYRQRKVKSQYGLTNKSLEDLQSEFDKSNALLKQIKKERPEQVFDIQLDIYKSGGGQTVDERAKWASSKLKGLKGKEFNDTVNKMLEAKVLTKSVVKKLREMGVSVSKYNSGGKIKSYGGKGRKGRKIKVTRRKITISKVKMPKLSSVKLKPLKLTKAPSSKIVRDKKLYKAINIKQPKKIRKIRVAKLPTMKVSKGGFLT